MTAADSVWHAPLAPAGDGRPVGRVVLKPGKAAPFFGRHPWVLDKAVDRIEGDVQDGDPVDLLAENGKFIARGLVNRRSRIMVRLYSWRPETPLDGPFWQARLLDALELRRRLGRGGPEDAVRLVFSEGDLLSGMIVDRYAEHLVIQLSSLGMARQLAPLVPWLADVTGVRSILLRLEKGMAQVEGLPLEDGTIHGTPPEGPVLIAEHGIRYEVDLTGGQKTGFYLDQRENRLAVARYLSGAKVLDAFCYLGAFAFTALRHGGAREVVGVDGSAKVVAAANRHAELNDLRQAAFETADVFQDLERRVKAGERFDAVLLDPPKFARNRGQVDDALRAYFRLNRLAVDLLPPGGILVTSSCSGQVLRGDLRDMLCGVAQRSGRDLRILEQRGAAPDHPVSASCAESEYLKCFICRVT